MGGRARLMQKLMARLVAGVPGYEAAASKAGQARTVSAPLEVQHWALAGHLFETMQEPHLVVAKPAQA